MFYFPKAIKRYKLETDSKNSDISRETGSAMSTVSNWCTGRAEPSLRLISELCSRRNIKLSEFISWGE